MLGPRLFPGVELTLALHQTLYINISYSEGGSRYSGSGYAYCVNM